MKFPGKSGNPDLIECLRERSLWLTPYADVDISDW